MMKKVDDASQLATQILEYKSDVCVANALSTNSKKVPKVALTIHLISLVKEEPRHARYAPDIDNDITPTTTPNSSTFL